MRFYAVRLNTFVDYHGYREEPWWDDTPEWAYRRMLEATKHELQYARPVSDVYAEIEPLYQMGN